IPGGIKGARVAHEFADAHPVGQVILLIEIADAAENAGRVGNGIEAEDADTAGTWPQQTKEVLDEGGFAGPIGSDEAEDHAARHGEVHTVEDGFGGKAARQATHFQDGIGHGFSSEVRFIASSRRRTNSTSSSIENPNWCASARIASMRSVRMRRRS